MEEIVNKVASSALEVFDLEDYYQEGIRTGIDISQWLVEGFLLKEKDFREALKQHDWSQYKDHFCAIYCSTDAILPTWAPILVSSFLNQYAKKVIVGNIQEIDVNLYIEEILRIDFSKFLDKPVILKGCSRKPVPKEAYIMAMTQLQKVAKSVMFGEACSAVPIYKRTK
ncbi:DUF2480 family protein [Flavobacterium sp.]|uniref:DUF2480 family protein n=1 Tax=Flavobacterium sp. TaxID=239 RepID=UPI003D0BF492